VKVSCSEGVANHTDLESCVTFMPRGMTRSVARGVGRPAIEPRKLVFLQDADVIHVMEGNMRGSASASFHSVLRGQRPWHVCTLLAREPGELWIDRLGAGPHREGRKGQRR
jgi:hypothetical protein